uniref:Uncharacterized protein n=1 Tax=Tolypothrix bouteillei VB521301 TaxID=1479485 RepID=A0A0C1N279_9CYAN
MFDIYNSSANFSDDCMISLAPVDSFVEYANYYLSRSKNELYCALGNSLLSNLSSVQRSDKISVNPFDDSSFLNRESKIGAIFACFMALF